MRSFICDVEVGSWEIRGIVLIVLVGFGKVLLDLVIVLIDVVCLVSGFDISVGVGIVIFVIGLLRFDIFSRFLRLGLLLLLYLFILLYWVEFVMM